MDNNTTYIDNFISTRNRVKEWTEYFPKPKEGKNLCLKSIIISEEDCIVKEEIAFYYCLYATMTKKTYSD